MAARCPTRHSFALSRAPSYAYAICRPFAWKAAPGRRYLTGVEMNRDVSLISRLRDESEMPPRLGTAGHPWPEKFDWDRFHKGALVRKRLNKDDLENDYLHGLGDAAAKDAAAQGQEHHDLSGLRSSCAQRFSKEAALITKSRTCAISALSSMAQGCVVLSDDEKRASSIHHSPSSQAKKRVFDRYNPLDLELKLGFFPRYVPKVVAFEAAKDDVSPPPVRQICDLAKAHGALTCVDGGELRREHVSRTTDTQWWLPAKMADKIDIISGSLAEAVGEYGGYVAASSALVNALR